jgi:hypothetical protein
VSSSPQSFIRLNESSAELIFTFDHPPFVFGEVESESRPEFIFLDKIDQIPAKSLVVVDSSIEFRVHLYGETDVLSIDFQSLKSLQGAFEGEGEPTVELKELPKLKMSSLNHQNGEVAIIFNDFTL